MKYLYLCYALFFVSIYAQTASIVVNGIKTDRAQLCSLRGEKTILIDTIKSSGSDIFKYEFKNEKQHTGMYRLVFGNNKVLDFVYDGKMINLRTDAAGLMDSMHVSASVSNRLFYEFVKLNNQYILKNELLQLILVRYPKEDEFYKIAQAKLSALQHEYLEFVNDASKKDPDSFIAKYICSSRLPVIIENLPVDKQLLYLKSHSLDNIDFRNAELIYSDLFTNKTIEYLSYYRNPHLSKEMLEKEFMAAVDSILNKAKVHHLVYEHIVEYLLDGFKKFGFDATINYIMQNYVIKDDLCLDEKTGSSIQRLVDQNKKLPVGALAPDLILPDISGREVRLVDLKAEKVLVLFYESCCPHCQTMIPKINDLCKSIDKKKLEIIAVSMDSNKTEWADFVKNIIPNWINVSDQKGWDGRVVSDYYIYATPTMFLLDRGRKIIGKPLSIEDLKKVLNVLN